jgi:hypothetical protein
MSSELARLDGLETSIPHFSSVCVYCRHLRVREGRTCAAFPERDSIPLEIWLGRNDHRRPVDGDHGIRFEPVEPVDGRRGDGNVAAGAPHHADPVTDFVP